MPYGIWLSYNNQEEGFQLPVMPGSIEIGDGISSKTYNVSGLGEINVLKNPKLTEYNFNGFFPALNMRAANGAIAGTTVDPFVTASLLLAPVEYVGYIKSWMETRRPIRFVFTGDSFDINTAASIENFDWKEVAGGAGDIEYTLKLKKYVFYAAQKVVAGVNSQGGMQLQREAPVRQNDRQPPKNYTITTGDTLWIIAKRFLGNGDRWYEIQSLNALPNDKLKPLPVGRVIKLPTGVIA